MRDLRREIARVAGLSVTVMIQGEIGTGRSLVGRAIHQASRRRHGPFLEAPCAELDPRTAASALFGYCRGAFSGADNDRVGWFEAAHRGTLLLDQIAEMPVDVQPLLLHILDEPFVRRLGETLARAVDVRLLVTTDRDLASECRAGRFREDLFYRLPAAQVHVPRLESRREDIPVLADAFRRQACEAYGRHVHTISRDAMQHLMTRSWPRNVAELRSTIEAAVLRVTGTVLEVNALQCTAAHHSAPREPRSLVE